MLNERSYTIDELIHYASIDDRFKPLLAERIATTQSIPTAKELNHLERQLDDAAEELHEASRAALSRFDRLDWRNKLTLARAHTVFAIETGATSAMQKAIDLLDQIEAEISNHPAT